MDQIELRRWAQIYEELVSGLQDFFKSQNFNKAVIGVSGGIDSALTLKIAIDALGADHVTALLMPEIGVTKEENMYHARTLCSFFGVKAHTVPINKFLADFTILPWKPSKTAGMNTKARIRMMLLYHFANTHHTLVLGTSNKSEMMLGYGTKFGDFAADIEVIAELYKQDVYALARYVGLPDELIEKAPTAELAPDQTDEDDLGASYRELDQILRQHDMGFERLLAKGINPQLLQQTLHRVEANKHKSEAIPTIKITHQHPIPIDT